MSEIQMNEAVSPEVNDVVAPAEPVIAVGDRLRSAREARGMSVDDIAMVLKLSHKQVVALEMGDWEKLPGYTFIRGFIRNYARLVHIEPETLVADLHVPEGSATRLYLPESQVVVMPDSNNARKRDFAVVLGGVGLVVLAVIAYFVVPLDFWRSKPAQSVADASSEKSAPLFPPGSQEKPDADNTVSDNTARATGFSSAGTISVATPTQNTTEFKDAAKELAKKVVMGAPVIAPSVAVSGAPASATPYTGKGLHFVFSKDAWVEVRDKSGKIVFSQLNAADSEREVEGEPPFKLIVGNASGVKVQYGGRDIELESNSKGDVARLTVE